MLNTLGLPTATLLAGTPFGIVPGALLVALTGASMKTGIN